MGRGEFDFWKLIFSYANVYIFVINKIAERLQANSDDTFSNPDNCNIYEINKKLIGEKPI